MIVKKVEEIAHRAAKSKNNKYGYVAWTHHIALVHKWGKILAQKLKANVEIVELACWLHDHSSIVNKKYYKQHHVHSARMAGEILTKLNYPEKKIEAVQECILCHRGSVIRGKESKEARILADADALAHFDAIPALFRLAYKVLKLDVDEGREFVLNKLQRSYDKMSPTAKALVKKRFVLIKKFLNHQG